MTSTPSWSESAFGVVHKSYKKLGPKLARVRQSPKKTDTFADRMKVNYAQFRATAGVQSHRVRQEFDNIGHYSKNPGGPKWADTDAHTVRRAEQDIPKIKTWGKKNKDHANGSAVAYQNNQKRRRRVLP